MTTQPMTRSEARILLSFATSNMIRRTILRLAMQTTGLLTPGRLAWEILGPGARRCEPDAPCQQLAGWPMCECASGCILPATQTDEGGPVCDACVDAEYDEDGECCCSNCDAETIEERRDRLIADVQAQDGAYALIDSLDGSLWDYAGRYETEEMAQHWADRWHDQIQAGNPGTRIIWHLMSCPVVAQWDPAAERWMEIGHDTA